MYKFPSNLHDITEIRKNQRFATYKATDENGDFVFIKQVSHEKLVKGLMRELYGLQRMEQLMSIHSFPFEVPTVKQISSNYLITTWTNGDTMDFRHSLPSIKERIEFMAATYSSIDIATETVHPGRSVLALEDGQDVVVYLRRLLSTLRLEDYFNNDLIEYAFAYLEKNAPLLSARFTHADLTPHNIIEEGHKRTVIDWESASDRAPRFYDVVNFTHNKALAEPDLHEVLHSVLNRTFELLDSDPEEYLDQLNTIALIRALSSIGELMSEPNEYHNTQDTMNSQVAGMIAKTIDNVLTNKLYIS